VNAVVNRALQRPEMQAKLVDLGFEAAGGTPEEFAAWIRKEIVKWAKIVKDSGAKAEGV
jgi:tripartite-type tricarboxylate transporter receptor subunit TctC